MRKDEHMTIVEFLLARIAEDESDARAEDENYAHTSLLPTFDSDHQARWHTDRALAECAAKRAIVEYYEWCESLYDARRLAASSILLMLATVYADHPDCRQEWKP